jgi:hypothetical protein
MAPEEKTKRVTVPKAAARMRPAGASRTREETRWGKALAKWMAMPPPRE